MGPAARGVTPYQVGREATRCGLADALTALDSVWWYLDRADLWMAWLASIALTCASDDTKAGIEMMAAALGLWGGSA